MTMLNECIFCGYPRFFFDSPMDVCCNDGYLYYTCDLTEEQIKGYYEEYNKAEQLGLSTDDVDKKYKTVFILTEDNPF